MSFDPHWLDLRARFDDQARDRDVLQRFISVLPSHPRLIDLGCGNGANLRHLSPALGARQSWVLVDHDRALLADVPRASPAWVGAAGGALQRHADGFTIDLISRAVDVRLVQADLAADLEHLAVEDCDGVVATALLDLTSAAWLDRLAALLVSHARPSLWTLTYDGRMAFTPAHAADAVIVEAFNADQRRDKGFGPALGPVSAPYLAGRLGDAGFALQKATSDWQIPAHDSAMLSAMVDGIAAAARMAAADQRAAIDAWQARRTQEIAANGLRMRIGHLDLLALPPK
ncbi:MAG: class I SAM-dependent methyltransferase [Geminicoccaceae bacterium]